MASADKLEAAFTAELLSVLGQAEKVCGTAEPRLAQDAEKLGGPEAVRRMLSSGRQTRQFEPLKKLKRLDLSPEALVIKGKYSPLFTDEEADLCLSCLLEAGMF